MDRSNLNAKTKKENLLIESLDWLRLVVICLALLYILPTFILRPLQVHGPSMYPTLQDGEPFLTNVAAYLMFGVDRFDIVALKDEESGEQWIKRVIGLPNETVEVRDGKLYINGEFVEEPFLEEGTITYDFAAVTLGEDEYFVMGDNRTNSLDSRKRGPFPKSAILGKYAYVYFPWDRWRAVTDGK